MKPWYETAFASHYPLLYAHRDQDEAHACLDLLHRLAPLPADRPVLDLGCGQGRHLKWLRERGVPALGLDLSRDLLRLAAAQPGADLPLVRGDMRHLPFGDSRLGAVLSLFTAFGYFGPLAANEPVVAEVSRVLGPGGRWYLDYVDCGSVRRELADGRPRSRQRTLGALRVSEVRRLVSGGEQVVKRVAISAAPGREEEAARQGVDTGGLVYEEEVALFHREELLTLAAGHGLKLIAAAGSYRGAPLDEGNRWILVLRKEGGRS